MSDIIPFDLEKKVLMDVEYYPELSIPDYDDNHKMKFPISDISALGTAFGSMPDAFRTVTTETIQAVEGVYKVRFPNGVGHLAQKGNEYLGAIVEDGQGIIGQARWSKVEGLPAKATTTIPYNPAMIFMAAALMNIDKKLDRIEETQTEILNYLEEKDRSSVRSDTQYLFEIASNLKYNWSNENYRSSRQNQVLNIQREANQKLGLYEEQITKVYRKIENKKFLVNDADLNSQLKKLRKKFGDYQLAVHLYAFSTYLDVMLTQNYYSDNLENISAQISKRADTFSTLYNRCYEALEEQYGDSVQAHLFDGAAIANKFIGKQLGKVPLIKKTPVDSAFIKLGSKIEDYADGRTPRKLNSFENRAIEYVQPFVESIDRLNFVNNKPVEMLMDDENIYFIEAKDSTSA